MKKITHEDVKKMIFASSPEVKKYYDEELLNEKISLQIKEIRHTKKITQLELAEKANTTQSIIARIES
jgi:DNA-binding transcriptional regulator YiaG